MSSILAAIFGGLVVAIPAYHIGITRQRAEAFAYFLRKFHQSARKATDLLHDESLKEVPSILGVKLYDTYLLSLIAAQVAALYMSENNRRAFLCKMKEYYDLHSSPDMGSNRFDRLEEIINDMQNIFASELSPILCIKNRASSLLSRATKRSASSLRN